MLKVTFHFKRPSHLLIETIYTKLLCVIDEAGESIGYSHVEWLVSD